MRHRGAVALPVVRLPTSEPAALGRHRCVVVVVEEVVVTLVLVRQEEPLALERNVIRADAPIGSSACTSDLPLELERNRHTLGPREEGRDFREAQRADRTAVDADERVTFKDESALIARRATDMARHDEANAAANATPSPAAPAPTHMTRLRAPSRHVAAGRHMVDEVGAIPPTTRGGGVNEEKVDASCVAIGEVRLRAGRAPAKAAPTAPTPLART